MGPRGRLLIYRAMQLWLRDEDSEQLEESLQQGISAALGVHDITVCYGYAVSALRAAAKGEYSVALETIGAAGRLMQRWLSVAGAGQSQYLDISGENRPRTGGAGSGDEWTQLGAVATAGSISLVTGVCAAD